MMAGFLATNAPALLIAVPLLGAFLAPVIGYFSRNARALWVLAIISILHLSHENHYNICFDLSAWKKYDQRLASYPLYYYLKVL